MKIYSYHLATTTPDHALRALYFPPSSDKFPGLLHAECMMAMSLGSPILSSSRFQLRHIAMFASWESEGALESYLSKTKLGKVLSCGWHVRLRFMRRWGYYEGYEDLPESLGEQNPSKPVVAVTIARLKLPELLRFIRWGKPVEEQVRDHPATSLAIASFRPPRTFSTFSVWSTLQEMKDMVHGFGDGPHALRHSNAMQERARKDFHHQFTTLRFKAISEFGKWQGGRHFVPGL